jgi:hypothetical protein
MKVLVQLKYLPLMLVLKGCRCSEHGNIRVFALQMCVITLNFILGEMVGGTRNEAQAIWEMMGHLCSASDTGEKGAADDIC